MKQTRVVNGVNEYLSITDDFMSITRPYTQTHDAAGNMTVNPKAITVGDNCLTVGGDPPCGEGQKYAYDEENRVTSIRRLSDDELLAEYEYDALGRRVHTIEHIDAETGVALATPKKTRHIYAGIETIEEYEVTEDEYGVELGATLQREFVWGNAANFPEPVAMIDHTDAGQACGTGVPPVECVYHYVHDVLGSVVGLTDASGTLVERYTYDPYGQTLIERWDATANSGAGAWLETNASTYANPWSWTGQRYDPAVHLYAFFARTYSPTLGRWLHRDPLGYVDGVNLYQYITSNPLFSLDPLGLCDAALQHRIDRLRADMEWAAGQFDKYMVAIDLAQSKLASYTADVDASEKAIARFKRRFRGDFPPPKPPPPPWKISFIGKVGWRIVWILIPEKPPIAPPPKRHMKEADRRTLAELKRSARNARLALSSLKEHIADLQQRVDDWGGRFREAKRELEKAEEQCRKEDAEKEDCK